MVSGKYSSRQVLTTKFSVNSCKPWSSQPTSFLKISCLYYERFMANKKQLTNVSCFTPMPSDWFHSLIQLRVQLILVTGEGLCLRTHTILQKKLGADT